MHQTASSSWKRQWGSERKLEPLPILHERPTTLKIALSRAAVVVTILFWLIYVVDTVIRQFFDGPHSFQFTIQAVSYLTLVTFLNFSALMYLLARQGALQRFRDHVRVPRAELEAHFTTKQSGITVLIPSYDEEISAIRKTIISALIQEYPSKRVVLLVDDKPNQSTPAGRLKLSRTRKIGTDIKQEFSAPWRRFSSTKNQKGSVEERQQMILEDYHWAVEWLETFAAQEDVDDHVDVFFVDHVIRALAHDLGLTAKALAVSIQMRDYVAPERLTQLALRLRWIFSGNLEVFERKTFASLSQEANKAMNLNSYIGLMGGAYQIRATPDGRVLIPVNDPETSDIVIPDSEFLLTLDADSILLREYCLRLVYFLQQPDNKKVAVVQTPYSAFRGAPTRLERLAGATTDVQHILHQGLTHFNATFWVGANAIIRKQALEDIVEQEWIGGFEIKRYIQDRTVIEDTESSIDISVQGWKLVNYPERLSYSATPPDFGSLIVQRRRWANGGLLIMPKLFLRLSEAKRKQERLNGAEVLLRINYMASIAWASFGLLFMLAYPYDGRLLSWLVVLAAVPYFVAQASDLKYCGYNRSDIFNIYGFNLILLPVNLAGVLKSIQQALTNEKIPFARTPKIKNRTTAPAWFFILPILLVAFSVATFIRSYDTGNWVNAGFAALNAVLATWAIIIYIGVQNIVVDLWVSLKNWLFVESRKVKKREIDEVENFDWRAALYHGDETGRIPMRHQAELIEQSNDHHV